MSGHGKTAATEWAHRDAQGRLVITGHTEVVEVAHHPHLFSNDVSRFLQVPNGLDGEAHAAARGLLDPFFAPDRVDALEPLLRRIADEVLDDLEGHSFDAVADLGVRFAVRAQSEWLGWNPQLEQSLLSWVHDSRQAARSGDSEERARVASEFDRLIATVLDDARRDPERPGVTGQLLALRTEQGVPLSDVEIISVLRNWTGGDLTSLALCTGVIVHWLASHAEHQAAIAGMPDAQLDAMIDEILRLDDPFVTNRRRVTADTIVAGCPVNAGEVIVLDWREATRDPRVFTAGFDPEQNAAENLVYGTGVHVCPGRGLATRELRVLVQALASCGVIRLDATQKPAREVTPRAGWQSVFVSVNDA